MIGQRHRKAMPKSARASRAASAPLARIAPHQSDILRQIARGADLPEVLERLVVLAEEGAAPARCAILTADRHGQSLRRSSPAVPSALVHALGLALQEPQCDGWTAPAVRKRAAAADFCDGHTQTIVATSGEALGAIALLYPRDSAKSAAHHELLDTLCALAAIAIERDRAAHALRSADERFASLAASVPGVVYQRRVGPDGDIRYTYISEGVRDLFGVSPEEVLADPHALFARHDASYAASFRERLLAASKSLEMWDVEASIITRDGQQKFTHAIARPHRQSDGSVLWNGIILDQTRIKLAEMAAAAAEARSREAIIESLPQGLTFFDPNDRLLICNSAYLKLYPALRDAALADATYENVIAAEIACAKPTDHPLEARVKTRLERHGRSHHSAEMQLPDGRWILVSERRSTDGGTVVLHADVTRLKEREAERSRLQDQLFRAQKMESMGRLAGGIAHDFNNILAAILGNASFLVEDLPADSELHEFAQQIMTAGQRAKQLVEQILAFSRQQSLDQEGLDPQNVVREAVEMLRAAIPTSIKLSVRAQAGEATIRGNATQLVQVLMNLCVNARDAIGNQHGAIDLELDLIEPENATARSTLQETTPGQAMKLPDGSFLIATAPLAPEKRYLRVRVRDSGCGMEARTMEVMFDPFFTTKDVGKGTGLGLAAVHGIVSAHGGIIAVRSRPGDGTIFDVFLPTSADASIGPARTPDRIKPAGTESILVVDDERQVSSMVARALKRLGYKADCFSSGAEALKAMRGAPGAWSLAITDQTMPEMTGLELVQRIRAERPDFPVILCSGYMDSLSADDAAAAGVQAFLPKPVDPDVLARTVRDLLDRRGSRAA